jgi:hypothetical protein
MFEPELPGVARNIFVHTLAELSLPRDSVEAGKIFSEFYAVNHPGTWGNCLGCRRFRITGIIGHETLLE